MEQVSKKLFDLLKRVPKSYLLPIGLSVVGVIFLSIGLTQLSSFHSDTNSMPQVVKQNQRVSSASAQLSMQVDVEGAVVHPGVYALQEDARVQDGLIAAGGLSELADREVISKSLNLAAKLVDGVKIYVPKIGEAQAAAGNTTASVLEANSQAAPHEYGLVNINSASAQDLDALPGVGPATPQKIIAARPFSTVDELLARKAFSNSVFQKIKDKVTVY